MENIAHKVLLCLKKQTTRFLQQKPAGWFVCYKRKTSFFPPCALSISFLSIRQTAQQLHESSAPTARAGVSSVLQPANEVNQSIPATARLFDGSSSTEKTLTVFLLQIRLRLICLHHGNILKMFIQTPYGRLGKHLKSCSRVKPAGSSLSFSLLFLQAENSVIKSRLGETRRINPCIIFFLRNPSLGLLNFFLHCI